jgi:HSP20 family protein
MVNYPQEVSVMTQANRKADVVPVKAKTEALKTEPHALNPFEEMERLFEASFPGAWLRPWRWPAFNDMAAPFEGRLPRIDVIDRENEVLVRADLPGVNRDDIEVTLTDHTVRIMGSTSKEDKEEEGNYFRRETMRGEFSRTVSLPADVNTEKASAMFKDGVLELVMPKNDRSKRRSIKIN